MNEIKLHLGCDKRYLKGYVHIDLADYPHIDYKSNINNLTMFDDNSVNLIYASHVLEYFDRFEVEEVINEWARVLKTKGILRLAVPNFQELVNVYNYYKDLSFILGPLYGRWEVTDSDIVLYHKTVYDYNSLAEILISSNFTNIRTWDWEKVFIDENDGFDDYSQAYIPHMDKDNGKLISLNIEAEKL